VSIASLVGGVMLVVTGMLSSEFLAAADNGEMTVKLEMPAGTALEVTDGAVRTLETRLQRLPEVERIFTTVGQGGDDASLSTGQASYARIVVTLLPKGERTRTAQELVTVARELGNDIPGASVKAAISGPVNGDAAPIV